MFPCSSVPQPGAVYLSTVISGVPNLSPSPGVSVKCIQVDHCLPCQDRCQVLPYHCSIRGLESLFPSLKMMSWCITRMSGIRQGPGGLCSMDRSYPSAASGRCSKAGLSLVVVLLTGMKQGPDSLFQLILPTEVLPHCHSPALSK